MIFTLLNSSRLLAHGMSGFVQYTDEMLAQSRRPLSMPSVRNMDGSAGSLLMVLAIGVVSGLPSCHLHLFVCSWGCKSTLKKFHILGRITCRFSDDSQ